MVYGPHALIAFGGPITNLSPGDTWQCGVRVRVQQSDGVSWNPVGLTDPAGFMNALAPGLKTWFGRAAVVTTGSEFMGMRQDATLSWLKVNNIGPDGKYTPAGYSNIAAINPVQAGSVTGLALPSFVTLAVSTLTALSRGPGHRGRIYLPLGLVPTSNDQIGATLQAQANGTVRALFDLIKATPDSAGTVQPIVASKINGATNQITAVACGNVLDVQRRRKEQIPETYVTHSWP